MRFLPPPGVSLVTSEGLSCVEVELDDDDMDPDELSKLAGLHLLVGRVCPCFSSSTDGSYLELVLLSESDGRGEEVGAPLGGRVCPCFSSLLMGHTWSLFFCQKAIEEAMWTTPSLEKAEILQDTRSSVIPRSLGEGNATRSCDQRGKKFFYVYVDNLGVLGTSRERKWTMTC